ncbi:hypothetical protein OG539_43465 [Actinacidiphila glaucinigra]|uniref:hypothetical protein n=1 Tax=Actinacidiphila glaucinigra TaxID=235986 RepID=UPI00324F5816
MSADQTPIHDVHTLWLQTMDFLHGNATPVWAEGMRHGAVFLMSPAVAALPRPHDRSAALARDESERLRAAQLFYVSAAAAQVVADTPISCLMQVASLLPSPSGLMVWEEPPARIEGGIPVRAASWGPAYDDGSWWSWWTDTACAVRAGHVSAMMLQTHGGLIFHNETHIAPGMWPAHADDPRLPLYNQAHSLVYTWAALALDILTEAEELPPTPAEGRQMKRAGLARRPVRRLEPASTEKMPTVRRMLLRQLELENIHVEDRPYPRPLPKEVADRHVYLRDRGHSVAVKVPPFGAPQMVPSTGHEIPVLSHFVFAPVKSVLRAGWQLKDDGFLYSQLRYEPNAGLLTDPDDDEF